jgi:DNA-binding MarR family transcriptional regulator
MADVGDPELWNAWKHAADGVRQRIAGDISRETGLSDGDFGIVTRLAGSPGRSLRQNELGVSLGWQRSRLSRQLTRMQERDLVGRSPVDGGVLVTLTEAGAGVAEKARPVHARAIHDHLAGRLTDHLAGRLTPAEREDLLRLVTKLID